VDPIRFHREVASREEREKQGCGEDDGVNREQPNGSGIQATQGYGGF
jgi:hypothetical protein